ncbi:MAG: hypothetical protein COB49_06175 [Alphaproteobacteria bacterium]|nr:MAG: hypothetical protein COB49_06175 [Alphaproteobacteria bacterium]
MKINVGKLDKILRIVVGIALVASALAGYFVPWGWIGIIPLVTGLIGWCPAYSIFGISSCPLSESE